MKKRATRRPEARLEDQVGEILRGVRELQKERATKKRAKAPKFRDWAISWFADYAKRPRKPNTIALRKDALRLYLVPVLGRLRIDEIGQDEIQAVRDHLEWMEPPTLNGTLGVLAMMLKEAADPEHRLIEHAPRIRLSVVVKKRRTVHDVDPYLKVVETAERMGWRHHIAVLLCGDVGLRASEAAGLSWDRCDLDARILDISLQAYKTHKLILPKGNRARMAAMTDRLYRALKEASTTAAPGRVLLGKRGRPIGRGTIRQWVREAVTAAGVDPTDSARALRRTFANHLEESGASLTAIAEVLGHRSTRTTEKNYLTASRKSVLNAAQLLDEMRKKQTT